MPAKTRGPVEIPPVVSPTVALGIGYRLSLLPKELLGVVGAFASESLLFHSVRLTAEIPVGRFVLAPHGMATDLSSPELLIGTNSDLSARSMRQIKSDLVLFSIGTELRYPVALSDTVTLDVGVGLGLGLPAGTMVNNWVFESPTGTLGFHRRRFEPCTLQSLEANEVGCRPRDQTTRVPLRVDGYRDNPGGSHSDIPLVVPEVTLPTVGLRMRGLGSYALRVSTGLSLTGFWIGADITYDVAGLWRKSEGAP
jgi:hypothetical protein